MYILPFVHMVQRILSGNTLKKLFHLDLRKSHLLNTPLYPDGFVDTTPTQDSAMSAEQLELYFAEIQSRKEKL